ncbi:MAG: magnesium and cobalt transport protein CorA [Actinomycetota bacterium]
MITGRLYRDGHADGEAFDLSLAERARSEPGAFAWYDIVDPEAAELERLRDIYALHPVTFEDTLHRRQRPKVELFADYSYVVLRAVTISPGPPIDVEEHEVHALVGEGFAVTLRWSPAYPMDGVTIRWERHPELRTAGFALYVLLDEVVDGYLSAIEAFEDEADDLEDAVFEREAATPQASAMQERLFRLKRGTVTVRRAAMPLRQGVDLIQEEPRLGGAELAPYYRDVMDHVIRVVELADNVRDLLTSLLEVRVAQAANRLNEAMKQMTAWAGIILVPTMIAGIYGMNFRVMPELRWALGYPFALALMAGSAVGLYVLFKRKGWL